MQRGESRDLQTVYFSQYFSPFKIKPAYFEPRKDFPACFIGAKEIGSFLSFYFLLSSSFYKNIPL